MARQQIERADRQPQGTIPHHGRAVSRRGGFTLVEIALALMIFSMGVLAVFLLFGRALDRESDALRYTRMALFGDSVMEALQAQSEYLTETASSNEWSLFWDDLADGQTQVVCAAAFSNGIWGSEMSVVGGDVQTNHYYALPLHSDPASTTGLLSHTIRYRMTVKWIPTSTNTDNDFAWVTLKVWEGAYGGVTNDAGMVFNSAFVNRGRVE
jgi:prepilin-type N-terminal cleavage/methylation domain-containing protein